MRKASAALSPSKPFVFVHSGQEGFDNLFIRIIVTTNSDFVTKENASPARATRYRVVPAALRQ
jgi:hypothetical protein